MEKNLSSGQIVFENREGRERHLFENKIEQIQKLKAEIVTRKIIN